MVIGIGAEAIHSICSPEQSGSRQYHAACSSSLSAGHFCDVRQIFVILFLFYVFT